MQLPLFPSSVPLSPLGRPFCLSGGDMPSFRQMSPGFSYRDFASLDAPSFVPRGAVGCGASCDLECIAFDCVPRALGC